MDKTWHFRQEIDEFDGWAEVIMGASRAAATVTAEVKVAAKKKAVNRIRGWLRQRHWIWCVLVFITWTPLQALATASLAMLGNWLPFIGPAILTSMTAWVDDVFVFAYATVVGPEILRRLGFWDEE